VEDMAMADKQELEYLTDKEREFLSASRRNGLGIFGQRLNKARGRIEELESAIRKHRDQTDHNMCWENDQELWAVLNDSVVLDHTPPDWDEFMIKCVEYRKSRE